MTEFETEFHNYITLVKEAAASVKSSQSQSTEESPAIRSVVQRCELSAAFKKLAKLIGHQFGRDEVHKEVVAIWEEHQFTRMKRV